jgi:NAD(P)-dependent dehydrogenase (short-subunit alcohol dehydrogenase family)
MAGDLAGQTVAVIGGSAGIGRPVAGRVGVALEGAAGSAVRTESTSE